MPNHPLSAIPSLISDNSSPSSVASVWPSSIVNTGFRRLLRFPLWIVNRVEELDTLLDARIAGYRGADGQSDSFVRVHVERPPPPGGIAPMPGPWGFFASGYAVVLFAMALLLNRIQHIVVPSRQNPRLTAHERHHLSFARALYASIFPMDLSSTFARTLLRIPSLYFISRILRTWCILILQSLDIFPSLQWSWLQNLGDSTARLEMESICWSTFLSVCGVLSVGALTRGLEGVGNMNAAPFNLFGYAFLLHIYSSPVTHTIKPEGLPSRPDTHVLFVIMMPLLQLSIIHALGVKQRWSNQRLVPTAICSALSLAHFHAVIWRNPSHYPLLNYMSCVFETLLILVILMTFGLHAMTQLILEGSVSRPLFGHADTLTPRWDEDFSVVLLRLGTASLEATSVAGLGNEVGSVPLRQSQLEPLVEYGGLEMGRAGIKSLTHASDVFDGGNRIHRKDGFLNEIRNIKVDSRSHNSWGLWPRYRELVRFGDALCNAFKTLGIMLWRLIRLRPLLPASPTSINATTASAAHDPTRSFTIRNDVVNDLHSDAELYDRFLAGDNLSDVDDDEFNLHSGPGPWDEDEHENSTTDSGDDDDDDIEALATNAVSTASARLLLAHMSSPDTTLTRRRYRRLRRGEISLHQDNESHAWDLFVNERRAAAQRFKPMTDENRRLCVICTVEERQIICWPCRCLALCDDCRENLASRFAPSKHTCPCCRQPVEGFSRIYIP